MDPDLKALLLRIELVLRMFAKTSSAARLRLEELREYMNLNEQSAKVTAQDSQSNAEQGAIDRRALKLWQEREMAFEPRLRRMTPDDLDRASGLWWAMRVKAALELGARVTAQDSQSNEEVD